MKKKRVDLKTGFLCNNNCMFCVQADKKKYGNRTTEEIKRDLLDARKDGCEEVVLTGGEPTIREDIIDLVKFSKKVGYKEIQLQTNGRRFYYDDFCRKIINAGMTQFSPALHGHTAELHDSLTRSPGSFNQTVKGIKNVKKYDISVITNTVVVKQNYKYLPEIAKLLVDLGVDQFQMAFVHPMGNAYKYFKSVVPKMSEAAPYIKEALQIGLDAGIFTMAEAMPYCLMEGYEKYISEIYIPPGEIKDIRDFSVKNWKRIRTYQGKTKFPQCKKCNFYLDCEGPWKEYPEKMGNKEFKPNEKYFDEKFQKFVLGLEDDKTKDISIIKNTWKELLKINNKKSIDLPEIFLSIYTTVKLKNGNTGSVTCPGKWDLKNDSLDSLGKKFLWNYSIDENLNIIKNNIILPPKRHDCLLSLYMSAIGALTSQTIEKNLFGFPVSNEEPELDLDNYTLTEIGFVHDDFCIDYQKVKKIYGFDLNIYRDEIRKNQIKEDIYLIKKHNPNIKIKLGKYAKPEILEQSDVVRITGSSLCNGTLKGILEYCKNAKYIILWGRSAFVYPSEIFKLGVSYIKTVIPPHNLINIVKNDYEYFINLDGGQKIIIKNERDFNE